MNGIAYHTKYYYVKRNVRLYLVHIRALMTILYIKI